MRTGGLPLARLRRPVERASQRQAMVDRIVAAVLVVVTASGLMSLLPGERQAAVSRLACRVGSLGLGSCGLMPPIVGSEQLAPPRCPLLSTFDETLPEVRVNRTAAANSTPIEASTARSGDMFVRIGGTGGSNPPFLLQGEGRSTADVLPGASVPSSAEWYLPGGQGADGLVQAVSDRYRLWVQRRSSLAILSDVFGDQGRRIPPPTILFSQVRLDTPVLPLAIDGSLDARTRPPDGQPPNRPGENYIAVVPGRPAQLTYNRINFDASLVVSVTGEVRSSPVKGSVRWTRDPSGAITSVLIGVVSGGQLVPGEPLSADGPSRTDESNTIGVAYIGLRVTSAAEEDLVADWLSDSQGFNLGLNELLGLRSPEPTDQLGSYLTRAATVTLLRYSGIQAEAAAKLVGEELVRHRRVEWPGGTLLAVSAIAPQPNRAPRTLVTDPSCRSQ